MDQPTDFNAAAEPLDLAALARQLWAAKGWLLVLTAAALGAAALYLNLATYRYTARLQVTAAERAGANPATGLAGLGSIVGVDIGLDTGSQFALFAEAVKSEAVARELARDEALMRQVFPADWDVGSGRWREPPSAVRAIAKPVKALLGIPDRPWQRPDSADLRDHLQRRLSVDENRKKAITTLSYEHRDPEFARTLIERAARAADDFLRAKSLARSSDYVAYLEARLAETSTAEYRLSLAQALTSYENMRMMASASAPYAAEPFGPSVVSKRPTSPQPLVVLGTAVLAAVLLWAGVALLVLPSLRSRGSEPDVAVAGSGD